MSYGRLQNEHKSTYAVSGSPNRNSSALPNKTDVALVSDFDDTVANGEPHAYELQNLSASSHRKTRDSEAAFEPDLDDSDNDEDHNFKARRGSVSTTQTFMLYTPDEERAVIKKFDRRLVLFVAFLYMLSFLDRSNIGNAKIAGLSEDLRLNSDQFEWLLRAFYITYISFEWMTLLWKVFPPHIYLAVCVASWGVIASLQSLAFSFWSMFTLRALLGIGEAAFVGVPFYMSFFYRRDELAFRTGLFISAAPLATSFAGSLAWAITKFGDQIPIASWRILFLVEGFPSVIVAIFVYLNLPDSPEKAKYLTSRQRRVAGLRLRKEKDSPKTHGGSSGLKWKQIRGALTDPICYITAAMFFCCNVAFSSLPVFLPTIIEEMGYSALTSQALSAPPFLTAFFTVLLTAYLSDRYRTRGAFVIVHALLAASGYATMAIAGALHASPSWRYIGVYPATMGFFSAITIIITWNINNQDGDSRRGTGLAMLNYIGQLGPLVGVHLYPDEEKPYYVKGMAICAVFMGAVAVLAFGLRWFLGKKNRNAAAGKEDEEGDEGEGEGLVGQARRTERAFVFML